MTDFELKKHELNNTVRCVGRRIEGARMKKGPKGFEKGHRQKFGAVAYRLEDAASLQIN